MRKEAYTHLIVWILYILFQLATFPPVNTTFFPKVIDISISFLSFAGVFYIYALFIFPRYLQPIRYEMLLICMVISLGSFLLLHYGHYYYLMPLLDDDIFGKAPVKPYLLRFVWWYFYYAIIGVGYWSIRNNMILYKRKNELEKNLLEAEIAFLKYQFNPHFLYNTLSFIYAKSFPLSPSLSKAVLLLTDIMRYVLQGIPGEKVPLKQELQHLDNFIELHRLRFNHKIFVNYTIDGDPDEILIVPLIFISFVENAFKHGQLNKPSDPLIIDVKIKENKIYFYTKNKKSTAEKGISTGIGLNNVVRRLDIRYKGNYELEIIDEEEYFICKLQIIETGYDFMSDY